MNATRRTLAAAEWLLIVPALLFFSALAARAISPAANGIAMWYAGRQWTLPVFLVALPIAVLVLGWKHRASRYVSVAMIAAAAVLVRVAVHFVA